jgi:hypothetical protein
MLDFLVIRPLVAVIVFLVFDVPGLLFSLIVGVGGGLVVWAILAWLVDVL